MTEREKMLGGLMYDTSDEELKKRSTLAHDLCREYNALSGSDGEKRSAVLKKLLPHMHETGYIEGPIQVDYGDNMYIGKKFYANFNFTALDSARITIGDDVMFGPNCTLVTPVHPFLPDERNIRFKDDGTPYNLEYSKPITIGNDCWIASNVTIIGGVKIGDGCVIGAGSVVTKDIPAGSLAVGNPCRVIRAITEKDRIENR